MPEPKRYWLISAQVVPVFTYPDGEVRNGSAGDVIRLSDRCPAALVAEARLEEPPAGTTMVYRVDRYERIYSAILVDADDLTPEQIEVLS